MCRQEPHHSVQNEAQRGQTTHPGAGAEPVHPRGGLGWEEQDAVLAEAHWQPREASAQLWGGLSSQFFRVPDVSESVPTTPVGHGQVSVSSLPQGPEGQPGIGIGKVKGLVAQCLSVRTPATRSASSHPRGPALSPWHSGKCLAQYIAPLSN